MPTSPVTPFVFGSGTIIGFKFFDGATPPALSLVDSMASDSESQQVVFSATPPGSSYTLGFGGQTTGPLATALGPPQLYFEWPLTLPSAGSYDLWVSFGSGGGPYSPAVLYEVFDGAATTPLGTATVNQQSPGSNPTPVTDSTLAGDGTPVNWYAIGTNYTFTGTSGRVRMSCAGVLADQGVNGMNADHVRIVPHGGGTATYQGTAGASKVGVFNTYHNWNTTNDPKMVGPSPAGYWSDGLGAGAVAITDPAAVQAAMTGLSSIGAGNMAVAGSGSPFDPLTMDFQGTLAVTPQPLVTSSDATVQVTRKNAGGLWPAIKINGGSPIKLTTPLYYSGDYDSNGNHRTHSPYISVVAFPLLQAHQAVAYANVKTYDNSVSGSWNTPNEAGISLSVADSYFPYYRITTANDATASATWPRPALKPGTYRISITRPHDASFSAATTWKVTDRAGTVLSTTADDQTQALAANTDGNGKSWLILGTYVVSPVPPAISGDLTVTLANGTSTRMVADTVRFERTSADDSVKILPTDRVTVSYGAAWATSVYGPCAAATDAAVENLSGGAIYPPLPTSVSMGLGWNMLDVQTYSGGVWYSNLMRYCSDVPAAAIDADGYPTRVAAVDGSVFAIVLQPGEQKNGDGLIMPSMLPGDYTLQWDGQSDMVIEGATPIAGASVSLTPGAVNNRRVYRLDAAFRSYGVSISVRFYAIPGTDTVDARNVRITSNAEVPDPASIPKFMPSLMTRKVAGSKSTRFMVAIGAISGNSVTYADFEPPQSRMSRCSPLAQLAPTVASIGPYSGPINFDPTSVPALFTTTAPHGLATGQWTDWIEGISGTATLSDSQTIDLSTRTFGHIWVVSDTTFAMRLGSPDGASGQAMTNTVTPANCRVHVATGIGMPVSDMVEFCNQVDSDLLLNIPVTMSDAAATAIGDYIGANLNPGRKVWLEYGNENWDFSSKPYSWISQMSYQRGLTGTTNDYVPFMVTEANRYAGLIRTAMAAHGRGSDLSIVMNTRFYVPGEITHVCEFCIANPGLTFDMAVFSLYFDNQPSFHPPVNNPVEPPLFPINDMLTAEQVLDVYELMTAYTGWDQEIAIPRAAMKSAGESAAGAGDGPFANALIGAYEGGPERDLLLGPAGYTTTNAAYRSHQTRYHPRYEGLTLHILRTYADSGCSLFHIFHIGSGDGGFTDNNYSAWSAYVGTGMMPYVASAQQDAIQVDQFNRLDLIQSPTGGAFNTWQSLYSAPPPAAATSFAATVTPGPVAPGSAVTETVTPDGTYTGTITGTPSGTASAGLSPVTLTFSGSAAARTASWTPTVAGTLTITWTSSPTLTAPAPAAVAVAPTGPAVVAGLRVISRILVRP